MLLAMYQEEAESGVEGLALSSEFYCLYFRHGGCFLSTDEEEGGPLKARCIHYG
jgi:hypothetical protein